jgi:hypothetical protein
MLAETSARCLGFIQEMLRSTNRIGVLTMASSDPSIGDYGKLFITVNFIRSRLPWKPPMSGHSLQHGEIAAAMNLRWPHRGGDALDSRLM